MSVFFRLNVYEPNENLVPIETRRENQTESLELKLNMVVSCVLVLGTNRDPLRQ